MKISLSGARSAVLQSSQSQISKREDKVAHFSLMAPRAFMLLLLLSTATATTTRFQLYGDAQGCDTADTPDASMPIDTRYRTARCTLIPGRMRTVWSRAGTEIPEGWRVGCKRTSETATRYLCCSESDGEECNMRLDGYYNPGECHEVQDGECTFYGGAWYKVEEETTASRFQSSTRRPVSRTGGMPASCGRR